MGREIRRVPGDWEHPRWRHEELTASQYGRLGKYRPCFDRDYEGACREWYANAALWCRGEHPDQKEELTPHSRWYHEWDHPPDSETCRERAWQPEEATHFQVYETVTSGTPITPVFATLDELIDHLVAHGTDWDDGRGWDRGAAEAFARSGHAFSAVMGPGGVATPRDATFWEAANP